MWRLYVMNILVGVCCCIPDLRSLEAQSRRILEGLSKDDRFTLMGISGSRLARSRHVPRRGGASPRQKKVQ